MKKTLVALAVLAASGASFAQVTITGNLNMGYRWATTGGATSSDASGLGIDTSNIYFAAGEDLGGGMSVAAKYGIDHTNRSGVGGGDASLALKSAAGTLTFGQKEFDTDLSDTSANVSAAYLDYALYHDGTDSYHDYVSYGMNFGPVALTLSHIEAPQYLALGAGGAGSSGTAPTSEDDFGHGQRENKISAVYAAGALTVEASYGSFDNRIDNTVGSLTSAVTLAGQYDLGVVKVGLGLQNHSYTLGSSADTALSFAVPVGAFSFGGIVGTHKIDDGVTSKTANGWGVQASYALSKRTSVYGLTRSVDYTAGDANKTTRSQVGISHSF